MHFRMKKVGALFSLFAVMLAGSIFVAPKANAATGDFFLLTCPSCQTVSDFENEAGYQAALRKRSGTYMIVGSSPVTGYIKVAGTQATTCSAGECKTYLKIFSIGSVTSGGAPANTDADLARNDAEAFGSSRVDKVGPVKIDDSYATSFIGTDDQFVSPGISHELLLKDNLNGADVPLGTPVLVIFPDGTKAVYLHDCKVCTYQWKWDKIHAWDKDGNPIDGTGKRISNPNVGGSGAGTVEASYVNRGGANVVYSMTTSTACLRTVTITWNGDFWGTWTTWASCN